MQIVEFLSIDKKRKAPQYWWCKPPSTGELPGGVGVGLPLRQEFGMYGCECEANERGLGRGENM